MMIMGIGVMRCDPQFRDLLLVRSVHSLSRSLQSPSLVSCLCVCVCLGSLSLFLCHFLAVCLALFLF